jgi:hypothetical protein
METLDMRGEYFDHRTGDTWDIFFPGYYRSSERNDFERQAGTEPIGHNHTGDWYFDPRGFDLLREHVEHSSNGRWLYSGGTDLVLIGGWMPDVGDPVIDWQSTISGRITDPTTATATLALPEIIERVSRDLEGALEAADYGVGDVTDTHCTKDGAADSHPTHDVIVNALGGIIAALGSKVIGI